MSEHTFQGSVIIEHAALILFYAEGRSPSNRIWAAMPSPPVGITEVNTINSFFGWQGGKKALRDIVVDSFPLHYDKYIEVFGGAAWVLFHKERSRLEVYNDQNSNLTNLFQCVREQPAELIDKLRLTLTSRDDFNRILTMFKRDARISKLQRAANYYQLIRNSYAAGCTSFSCQPHNFWRDFPHIIAAHWRLRNVLIENQDFKDLIPHYDDPNALFYLDPPYYGTEDDYSFVGFDRDSHVLLRDLLISIDGYFLLSYNDCEEIRELYDIPGIYTKEVIRLNNLRQRFEGGSQYSELLIANYDIDERQRMKNTQLSLFEGENENEII